MGKMYPRHKLVVTDRRLDELLAVFPDVRLFDYVVAENGALVYTPRTKKTRLLGKSPRRNDPPFVMRIIAPRRRDRIGHRRRLIESRHTLPE